MSAVFKQSLIENRNPYWLWGPLAFSIFYFLPIIFSFEHFTALRLLGVGVIYGLFLAFYIKAIKAQGEASFLPILGIVVLCILGTYVTPGTQALFGYAAFFSGFSFRFTKALQGLVGILLAIALSAELFSYKDAYFLAPALIVSIGMFFFGQAERKDRIHKHKESLSQQKLEQFAAIAERERIARDLHDLIGHSLSSIALKANLAEKLIEKQHTRQAASEIQQVAQLSRDMLSQVRQAVSGLKQYDINQQLEKLTAELNSNGFHVNATVNLVNLPKELELALLLITTELVTNILRHSNGDQVEIEMSYTPEREQALYFKIQDNGVVDEIQQGNGLTGIHERCQQIAAKFNISTSAGFCAEIIMER